MKWFKSKKVYNKDSEEKKYILSKILEKDAKLHLDVVYSKKIEGKYNLTVNKYCIIYTDFKMFEKNIDDIIGKIDNKTIIGLSFIDNDLDIFISPEEKELNIKRFFFKFGKINIDTYEEDEENDDHKNAKYVKELIFRFGSNTVLTISTNPYNG